MALTLYNTLARATQAFEPLSPPRVTLYTCGPTVYGAPHIGNYRAYITSDVLKRTLTMLGYDVEHVMNITDVDDKTIAKSRAARESLADFTQRYEEIFRTDIAYLNIIPPQRFTRATEHIDAMIALIGTLLAKGLAYRGEDGIYFSVEKFPRYGALAHLSGDLRAGASGRVRDDEYGKENPRDFALWKFWTPEDGDVSWKTALGKGRPGWHIECSAMSMQYLGQTLDVHAGGVDLVFPHHENEIAQCEGATGEPFVRYWVHNEWLLVDGKKMAKSLGNFTTLRDITDRRYDPLAFRYLILTAHYRQPLNFTFEALGAAQAAYHKLIRSLASYLIACPSCATPGVAQIVSENYISRFHVAIEDDLGIPEAVALLWMLVKEEEVPDAIKYATIFEFDRVLGLRLVERARELAAPLPEEIVRLGTERDRARAAQNWPESDRIRAILNEQGYDVEDRESTSIIQRTQGGHS